MRVSIEAPAVGGVQLIYIITEFCGGGFLYMDIKRCRVNKEWTAELNEGYTGEGISLEHANRVLGAWVLAGYPRSEF